MLGTEENILKRSEALQTYLNEHGGKCCEGENLTETVASMINLCNYFK